MSYLTFREGLVSGYFISDSIYCRIQSSAPQWNRDLHYIIMIHEQVV